MGRTSAGRSATSSFTADSMNGSDSSTTNTHLAPLTSRWSSFRGRGHTVPSASSVVRSGLVSQGEDGFLGVRGGGAGGDDQHVGVFTAHHTVQRRAFVASGRFVQALAQGGAHVGDRWREVPAPAATCRSAAG